MDFGAYTSPDIIMLALQSWLLSIPAGQTDPIFNANRVFITDVADHLWDSQQTDDEYAVLRMNDGIYDQKQIAGGGSYLYCQSIPISVTFRWRVDVDEDKQSQALLCDPTLGVLPVVTLMNTLTDTFLPVDNTGQCLLMEPARPVKWDNPDRHISSKVNVGWTKVRASTGIKIRTQAGRS